MPPDTEYSLQDLADLADVTPRTVRFYIAQGLLAVARPGRSRERRTRRATSIASA